MEDYKNNKSDLRTNFKNLLKKKNKFNRNRNRRFRNWNI